MKLIAPGGGMHQARSNYPEFQTHEKTLSTSEVLRRSEKLNSGRNTDQSLFSLLLEIESSLVLRVETINLGGLSDPIKGIASIRESTISLVIASSGERFSKKAEYIRNPETFTAGSICNQC